MVTIKSLKTRLIIAGLVIFDLIFLLAALFSSGALMRRISGIHMTDFRYSIAAVCITMFFFVMYDSYAVQTEKVFNAAVTAALSVMASAVSTFFLAYILNWHLFSVKDFFIGLCVVELYMVPWRAAAALFIKKFGEKRSCLIIENMNNTSRLARKLKYASNEGRESYYYMIDEENEDEVNTLIEEKIAQYDLIFISPSISKKTASKIMYKAFMLQKGVSVLADVNGVSTLHGRIYQLDDTPVIEKKGLHMSKLQRFVKRLFDIVFSLILSIVTLPIALFCMIAIKFDSEGPVFYKQERYTIDKKVFSVFKFRTMVQDAEKYGAQLATEDDPRITKVGKFLRATRLDELPQLYNILLGSMSVVGPRPERPVFADRYSETVNNYDMRYCVKAGLTGYAQVYGKYNTRVSDKILMDMIYVVNYSYLLDIKLILLTVKTMFIKSATEGVDEERDEILSSKENEQKRREETVKNLGEKNENINYHSGI